MKINSIFKILVSLALFHVFHTVWAQSAKLTQIVLQAMPVVTLTAIPNAVSSGASIQFDVKVAGVPGAVPTGSIIYALQPSNGAALLTSVVALSNGTSSWTAIPPAGNYTISAVYSGD